MKTVSKKLAELKKDSMLVSVLTDNAERDIREFGLKISVKDLLELKLEDMAKGESINP